MFSAAPNPVQVNTPIAIVFWVNVPPPTAGGNTGDRWQNYTLQITKPDATVVNLGPFVSDLVGSGYTLYTPDQTGTYNVVFSWPGQVLRAAGYTNMTGPNSNSPYVNDTFSGASANTTFVAQTQPVEYFQEAPLPVSYWTRPIDSNNRNWNQIASAWVGQNEFGATYLKYNPYGWAPNTAHVMWTYPLSWGGIVGGNHAHVDDVNFYSGTQYQIKFNNPIIMYGNVYFSLPANNAPTGNGVTCVSLRTGETLWTNPNIDSVTIGQLYDFESPNQHGMTGIYLWVTGGFFGNSITGTGITNPGQAAVDAIKGTYPPGTDLGGISAVTNNNAPINTFGWTALDPQTGRVLFNETNVPSGTRAYGPLGEWLIYNIGRQNNSAPFTYLWQWNNTKLPGNDVPGGITQWIPGSTNWNMSTAYDWNVTLSQALYPTESPIGASSVFSGSTFNETTGLYTSNPTILRLFPGNLIFGQSSGLQQTPGTSAGILGTPDPFTLWAINLNETRAPIGQVLWLKNYPAPAGNITVNIGPADGETNVFTLYYKETIQWVGYDMLTGNQLWGPSSEETPAWNYYTGSTALTNPIGMGYGHLYVAGYGGVLRAYDLKTGNIDFTFGNNASDPNNSTITPNTVYGDYPTQVAAIANNKVYLVEEEHSLDSPPYQGAKTRCVDAFTGKWIWDIYGMSSWQEQAVADGYYTWLNLNDMNIYCMGPGPSSTSLQATQIGQSDTMLIQGRILDQTQAPALKGTAAISDEEQGPWMQYMIQRTTIMPHVNGVPVQLTAIGENVDGSHTTYDLGIVQSDGDGLFSKMWTPPSSGLYTIVANFTGTQSYGPSSAEGVVAIIPGPGASPSVSPSQTPNPPPSGVTPTPPTSPIVTGTPSSTTPTGPGGISAAEIYVIVAAVVIIIIVVAAAVILRRRR
jgi:hypothetical protein